MKSENDFGQNKRSRSSNMSGYDEALAGGKYELRVLIPSKVSLIPSILIHSFIL